jgi:plastocyanin
MNVSTRRVVIGTGSTVAAVGLLVGGVESVSSAAVKPRAVTISGSAYHAASITVKKGTKVVWTNKDDMPHTVTGAGAFHSATIGPGKTYSFTFSKAGTFAYHCTIHQFMHGTVVVTK